MKITENSQLNLDNTGVYQIKNVTTDKIYIGSTTQSFLLRYKQHLFELKKGCHKNAYLQNAWNKHGENSFEFTILRVCSKEDCLLEEQKVMDDLNVIKNGYNINPLASGTPNLCKETIKKRSVTFKIKNQEAMIFYKKVKNQELDIKEVPEKYLKLVLAKINNIPWNKGLTKENTDFSYLKGVKKTITEKHIKGRVNFSETIKNKSEKVLVYNYKGILIKTFRCISDIVDYTKSNHDLPLILRTKGRKGTVLSNQNICNVCCGRAKHHKGLIFRYESSNLIVEPLIPSDIHRHWKEFKLQSATSNSNIS